MKFALSIETSEGVENKIHLISELSNQMTEYFSGKDYGESVKTIFIGIICVSPEFDWFSKIRKPKYVFYRKYIRDSSEITQDREFSFDIKLDYEKFANQTDEENRKMLASEIKEALSVFDNMPKKVKDFDKEQFKNDIDDFLNKSKRFIL